MSTSALVVNIAVRVLSGAPEQKIIQEFEEANNLRELFFRAGTGKIPPFCMKNRKNGLYLKKYNFFEKSVAKPEDILYTSKCCDMIALKREVAA